MSDIYFVSSFYITVIHVFEEAAKKRT